MNAVLKSGFLSPVKSVDPAGVGPLCEVVLRHEIDLAVVFAKIPVICGNALPSLGCVCLEHILRKLEESTVLGIRPSIEPVGCCSDKVYAAVHSCKCKVIV